MKIRISTTVTLSSEVTLGILNAAIDGGCADWADVAEREVSEHSGLYSRAKFIPHADARLGVVISEREIASGIQSVLDGGMPFPVRLKDKVLRMVTSNNASQVDGEIANSIVRAAMVARAGHMTTY